MRRWIIYLEEENGLRYIVTVRTYMSLPVLALTQESGPFDLIRQVLIQRFLGYSQSLTGCVAQLEKLCKYTKAIVGEQGYVS